MSREEEIYAIIERGFEWIYDHQRESTAAGAGQGFQQIPPDFLKEYLPVTSSVTAEDIAEVEARIGHRLPADYITLLKYKHFLELGLGDAWFRNHDAQNWKTALLKRIMEGWPQEHLINKGYIPFADWQDLGHYCFDASNHLDDSNYPVVRWDHEWPEAVQHVADDFFAFLKLARKMDRGME